MSITLISVRNPKWQTVKIYKVDSNGKEELDSDGKSVEIDWVVDGSIQKIIQCEAKWSHLGDNTQEWLPFAATPWDLEQHGKDLYAAFLNGDHGSIANEQE